MIGKSKKSGGFISAMLLGMGIGYAVMLVAVMAFAVILTVSDLGDGASTAFSAAVLGLSGLAAGFTAAKKFGSRALVIGFANGCIFYLTVAVVSAAVTREGFTSVFFFRMILTVASAVIGAFISAVRKSSHKII